MPISKRKLAANRANSKKSTGPTSTAGLEKVSQNRTVHGLCGHFQVLSWESQEDYDYFLNQLIQAEQPANATERELVVKMAQHSWCARRALRMQDACFSIEAPPPGEKPRKDGDYVGIRNDLPNYIRYHAAHDRAYRRASQELIQRRKERQIAARGFESQKRAEAEEARKAEKHALAISIAKSRKQIEEIRAAKALADILPPDLCKEIAQMPTPPANSLFATSMRP